MRVRYNYTSRLRKAFVILLAIIYMILFASYIVFARLGISPEVFGIPVSGVVGAVQIGIAIAMVVIEYELGGILAIIMTALSIASSLTQALFANNRAAIQGTSYLIVSLIIILIIRGKMKNEHKSSSLDDLTGISNRRNAVEYINYMLSNRKSFYVCHMGIKNFKMVNETRGLQVGDELIVDFTKDWQMIDPDHTFLARYSGSEFVAVIEKKHCIDIDYYVDRLIDVVRSVAEAEGSDYYYLSLSVGVADSTRDGHSGQEILRKAEIAFNDALRSGKNNHKYYQRLLEDTLLKGQMIESRVRKALEQKLFYMVFQPQFTAEGQKLRGYEALIRMKALDGEKQLYPNDFIPIAEQGELIIAIGEFVLKKTMSEFAPYLRDRSDVLVSVNISSKHLLSRGFVDYVRKTLEETGFDPYNLEIEITEYCLMETDYKAAKVVGELKRMGIKVAMDDFGTGYSSLAYLAKLPIDLIKIDKTIVDEIGDGEIVGAICSMGHSLECEVIAEGVEYKEQLDILREKNCDFIQGYYYSKPVSFEEAIEYL